MKPESRPSVLQFLVKIVLPFKWYYVLGIALSLCLSSLFVLLPYFVKLIVDTAGTLSKSDTLYPLIRLVIFFSMTSLSITFLFRIHDWLGVQLFPKMREHITLHMMNSALKHSIAFFRRNHAGNLTRKITDATLAVEVLKVFSDRILFCVFLLMWMVVSLASIQLRFAIGFVVWVIIFVSGSTWFLFRKSHLVYDTAERRAHLMGQILDTLTHILSVRLFSRKRFELDRLKTSTSFVVAAEQMQGRFFMRLHLFQGITFIVFELICFFWLLYGMRQGVVTTGDFVLIFSLNTQALDQFWDLSRELQILWENVGYIRQAFSTIEVPPEITNSPEAPPLIVHTGTVVFDHVRFLYHTRAPLFEDKSIVVEGKTKVGLVGYSGSGKTTFVNLIMRLYDVTSGNILIDGQDIRNVCQNSLHESIAIIPQDCLLFNRSLMENIRYGRLDATDEEVKEAAKKARIHDIIERLPQGYDTVAGERGSRLSGGQRQLIAIARALLKDAPILIFDEATSHLDAVTEAELQKGIFFLMKGKTVFVIAHRLSTLLSMDRILVFEKGKIVQDGSHPSLLGQEGLYKTLWDTQTGGFLPQKERTTPASTGDVAR